MKKRIESNNLYGRPAPWITLWPGPGLPNSIDDAKTLFRKTPCSNLVTKSSLPCGPVRPVNKSTFPNQSIILLRKVLDKAKRFVLVQVANGPATTGLQKQGKNKKREVKKRLVGEGSEEGKIGSIGYESIVPNLPTHTLGLWFGPLLAHLPGWWASLGEHFEIERLGMDLVCCCCFGFLCGPIIRRVGPSMSIHLSVSMLPRLRCPVS